MSSDVNQNFDRNVFINCPLDEEYFSLLRPLLFTIIYLGYNPRIALERSDSGEIRINKICELIQASQYSIHDLSRLKSAQTGEFFGTPERYSRAQELWKAAADSPKR